MYIFSLVWLYSTQDLLFPGFHSDTYDSLLITFANIEPYLSANPGEHFSIITRYFFESASNLDIVTANLQPLFILNEDLFKPNTTYVKDPPNYVKTLSLQNTMYNLGFYFINKNNIYTNQFFLCFDFAYDSAVSANITRFNLFIKLYVHNYNNTFNRSTFTENLVYSTTNLTIQDLKLQLNVENSSGVQTKISQIKIYTGSLSDSLLGSDNWDNFREIYYQLLFYQEPVKSKLLYNRSKYTFAPAINGDFSENNNEMHSFFSDELARTFWVGYDSVRAGFVQLPKALLSHIDSEFFDIVLYVDFYILTENRNHFDSHCSLYHYTLLTVLNKSGSTIFSFSHSCKNGSLSPGNSYMHMFSLDGGSTKKFGEIHESEFYKTNNIFILFQFHRTVQNRTQLYVYFAKDESSKILLMNFNFGLPFEEFDQIILGKHATDQVTSPLFAYFFNALHILLNRQSYFDSSTQAYKAYHGFNIVPFHVQSNPFLWFLPENPDELSAYNKTLKMTSETTITFQNSSCPNNCEICFDSQFCVICRSSFILDSSNECKLESSQNHFYMDHFGRNWIQSSTNHKVNENPLIDIDHDSSGYSQIRIDYFLNIETSILTNTPEMTCYIENNFGQRVNDIINWNFNNLDVLPFTSFQASKENSEYQIKIQPQSQLTSISDGTCEIIQINAYYFNPTCESESSLTPSLKGYMGFKYCTGAYVNITNLPYMITPEIDFTPGFYDYVIPVPGTSSFMYGKCKNNCKCWDGDLHTTKGFNSCFINPNTGDFCENSFGLINYSNDESRQACVDVAIINALRICNYRCDICDSSKTCLMCTNSARNRNYLDLDFYGLFCSSCHSDCLSCYGSSSSDCWCSSTKFGLANTRLDFDFNLCLPVAKCDLNCVDCRLTGCFKCRFDYYFDTSKNACIHILSKNCWFRDKNLSCIECLPNHFLDSGKCRKCSSNCQLCLEKTCILCKKGYVLFEKKCLSYYFLNSEQNVKKLSLPPNFHFNKIDSKINFSNIRYIIHLIFWSTIKLYIPYDKFVKMEEFSTTNLYTSLQYKIFLQNLIVLCNSNFIQQQSRLNNCDRFITKAVANKNSEINIDTICNQLLPGCARCISQKICAECQKGYILKKDKTLCISLHPKFAKLAVINTYSESVKIVNCIEGFNINKKINKCSKNIPNCIKMNRLQRCTICASNFKLNQSNTKCINCLPNCTKCLFANTCEKCAKGYFIFHKKSIKKRPG